MTLPYDPNVIFNPGAPINLDQLRKLQSNIAAVKLESDNKIQNATLSIEGVQKFVKVNPVIFAKTVTISINANRGYDTTDFGGTDFSETPIMVASIATNTSPNDGVTLRATATSKTGGQIEVFTAAKSTLKEVKVNFLAVQMKQVE